MVELLLKYGTCTKAIRPDGRTPLMMASLWGRLDSVRVLLIHGADPNVIDYAGRRAFDFAENHNATRKSEIKLAGYTKSWRWTTI
jgi:ankyrin repeat protein